MAKKTGDSVYKIVEVIGTSTTSWEEAGKRAVQSASKTLRDLRIAEVVKQDMAIENGKVVQIEQKLTPTQSVSAAQRAEGWRQSIWADMLS